MHRHLSLAGLAALLAAVIAGCGKPESKPDNLEGGGTEVTLDGHWIGFELNRPSAKCEVTITNAQLYYRGADTDDWCRGTIVLNDAVKPKQMDLSITESPGAAGQLMLLIYEQNGNEMKVAGATPGSTLRPAGFSNVSEARIWSFKRD